MKAAERIRGAWLISFAVVLVVSPLATSPAGALETDPPAPPTELRAYTDMHGVHLSWMPPSGQDASGLIFRVYRAEEGGPMELLAEAVSPGLLDPSAERLKTYSYEVTAANPNGESVPSDAVQRPRWPHCMVLWVDGPYGPQIRPECLFPLPIPLKL